ncbi:transglutaminaseTgpA domain-containing protein [Halorussus pelagicus]|uniref:transglutaminaseTgpA domain-containing protein n=1 Tax=Halorussus pelagicus TaxID=2505977 RepID=UPI000FFC2FEA|nr:transglutaminaseTgpA domain-containing protein [Halorussus pelagicus]
MPTKPSPLLPDDEQSRDRLRAALAACCVLAVVLAGTLVPAVSGAGLGSSPIGSVVPQPNVDPYGLSEGSGGTGSGGGLGALNPGDQTDVGGSLASEGTSAFRSQNAETHFQVQSSVPAYWRTGAYDTYTGSGWESSGERRPYDGPIEDAAIQGREVQYRVTLQRSATALPSVWRANSVEADADSLYVTDDRAFESQSPISPGTTYSGVSHLPARDPNVLRTAGSDYPDEIERRYTDLPGDADRRIGRFTDDLTADASSPYESATRIESWLESNKNYSLNVSEPAGEDVASQFVFDMEKGYCEYFATSMTVMLRSQDIPARYVVGYSTGQSVGANTYEVRGMNAHAWVEAYFPDVGWVKFDPTPGRERLDAEQRALTNQTDADPSDYSPNESGSPDERFSPNKTATDPGEGDPTATSGGSGGTRTGASGTDSSPEGETPTDSTESGETPAETTATDSDETTTGEDAGETTTETDSRTTDQYSVRLNRTPVPGATVEVTVTDEGTPAIGVPVFFNGEQVGITDTEGTVTGQVPYAENLRIAVGGTSDDDVVEGVAGPPTNFDAAFSLSDPPRSLSSSSFSPSPRALAQENGSNATDGTEYPLATDASLAVSGDVATGREVVVTATVEGVAVRNADVTLDGETVGTTDRNGRLRVRLPDSPGNVTLAVSRGSVSGERTLSLPRLELDVDPQFPLALPGTAVEISATYGGDPLTDATVEVAGANETTGINGTATASLPVQRSAEVVVSAEGQTRRATVSGLLVNLAGVLSGLALVLGGLAFGASRRGWTLRRLVAALAGTVRAIPDLAVAALFGAADRLARAVETVLDALEELAAGETTVSELLARLRAWFAERVRAVRAGSLRSLGGGPTPDVSGSEDAEAADSYRTLREAWATFLRVVSVRRPEASTPGELADHAVSEDGLPPAAVVTLRDAFRDVEYGARSPSDRLAHVEEAIDAIERAAREGSDARDSRDARSGGDD